MGYTSKGSNYQQSPPYGYGAIESSKKEEGSPVVSGYTQWATSDNSVYTPTWKTQQEITPGVYEIGSSPDIGIFFKKIAVKTEGLINFPDGNSKKVVGEIQNFWKKAELFDKYGLSFKRGILLFGPPGSGKSCTLQLIMRDVIQMGGIAINFIDPHTFIAGLRIIRQIQPTCPIVVIMEDIETTLQRHNESDILNILDGVNKVDYTVFLATTNHPNLLGPRIINRPSRFDKRFKIGLPNAEARRIYFEHIIMDCKDSESTTLQEKLTELNIDLDKWVKDTDKMSLAHLKELFIAVVILGDDYDAAVKTLSSMKEKVANDDEYNTMGFRASV